ncbi:anthranilate phosphoribosyltransferase [Coxiella burnetii]|uniref:anthranilate phosphoribosyltransferase n=1 Tax=Coxiella burnetii TaxID=777 RepID=UPI0028FC2F6A|nr:anthranilate phosphoribosyltransferase [Coxiella burnetii]
MKVAKHGNRAVSSQCGSADFLDSLNIPIRLTPQEAKNFLNERGFVFLYAPDYHPAMKLIKETRKILGIRTAFNLLGPLLNPACPTHLIAGVADKRLLPIYSDVLLRSNVKRALIVHGNGLDEINFLGPVEVIEIYNNKKKYYQLDPNDYNLNYCSLSDIQGGDSLLNKKLILTAFSGKESAISDTIIFNAGVAFYLMNVIFSIQEGINLARRLIKNGTVINYIEKLRVVSYA